MQNEVPSSQQIAQGGSQKWQTVSRIRCADDPGTAWQAFWSSRSAPQARQCRFADPRVAETADQQLNDILQAVDVRIVGTPPILREDGGGVPNKPDMGQGYVSATFGPAGAPSGSVKPLRWLTASAGDSFKTQPVGASAQQKPHVGINDAMNRLLER